MKKLQGYKMERDGKGRVFQLFVKMISTTDLAVVRYVTSVLLPPYHDVPGIIIWGSRAFVKDVDTEGSLIYTEAIPITVIEHEPYGSLEEDGS